MSTAQVNGTPSTASSTNNNGNAIKTIGVGSDVGVYQSRVIEGLGKTAKALSFGTFAHDHTLPIAFGVTEEIAGSPSSSLNSNGYNHENIRNPGYLVYIRTRRTTASYVAGNFNIFTGKFSPDPAVTLDPFFGATTGNSFSMLATDKAVQLSDNTPGRLTYLVNGKRPYSQLYQPRSAY
jgi:hypothetical protein